MTLPQAWPIVEHMPRLLRELHVAAPGRDVVGIHCELLDDRDDGGGLSLGFTFTLDDGSAVRLQTDECAETLARIAHHLDD